MDVHTFDGKLLESTSLLPIHLKEISSEDKILAFDELRKILSPNNNLETIIHDLGKPSNYDPTNNLRADDLLYLCYQLIKKLNPNDDLIFLLNEQFVQMNSGMCPQGRTHRLFQIVFAFEEFLF